MSLKGLTRPKMIELTKLWLGDEPETPIDQVTAYKLLISISAVKAFMPTLQESYDALVNLEVANNGDAVKKLTDNLETLDERHGRKARGVRSIIKGLMDLTEDPSVEDDLSALLDKLGLQTLAIVNASYLEEAGAATQVTARLDTASRKQLKDIPLPDYAGSNMSIAVDGWLTTAQDIGALESKRSSIQNASALTVSQKDVRAAMNTWINAVKTLQGLVRSSKTSPEHWRVIFGALEQSSKEATKPPKTAKAAKDAAQS